MEYKPFKLIAIKPLADWNLKYLKILIPGTPYYFYKKYTIIGNPDEGEELVIYPEQPPEIYDIGDIRVNISAVVGRNGSGKSSLVELLYVAMYNVSRQLGLLVEGKNNKTASLQSRVNVAIYYLLNERYYRLLVNGNSCSLSVFDVQNQLPARKGNKLTSKEQLADLFYSIVVNYSQYALNTDEFGSWLKSVFHKNDGYQTPIVINPFRNRGNIDINTENFLVRSRLLSNILEGTAESLWFNNNEKIPQQLIFSFIKEKFASKEQAPQRILENWQFRWTNLLPMLRDIFGPFHRETDHREIDGYAKQYVLLKMETISRKYSKYADFRNFYKEEHQKLIEPFLKKLKDDPSHIAFKFKQAVNFLRFDTLPPEFDKFRLDNRFLYTYPIKEIAACIEKIQEKEYLPTIELIPPSFLHTDIQFGTDDDRFTRLSSGEKQKIYALSSLVYHLKNLDSIVPDPKEQDPSKQLVKYRNINIIFDEVEMYYHPDLQRRFIKDMLDNIRVAKFKTISAINFLFVTHSPFILSDIPAENILYLDVKGHKTIIRQVEELTFGGNVHDMLAGSFFLKENGFMGEFARDMIQRIYDYLMKVINSQGTITGEMEVDGWTQPKARAVIERIGEPLVRNSLYELFNNAFLRSDAAIDAEIARLQERKKNP